MSNFHSNSNYRGGDKRRGYDRDRFRSPRPYQEQRQRRKAKVKMPPPQPKPCYVLLGNIKMYYNKEKKMLENGVYESRFPSRKKAHAAIWHTCQQRAEREGLSGKELWGQYQMVDAF